GVDVHAGGRERSGNGGRRRVDRHQVQLERVGVHRPTRLVVGLGGLGDAQVAVVGEAHQLAGPDSAAAVVRPLEQDGGAGVAQRERRQLRARVAGDVAGGGAADVRDELAGDHHAAPDDAAPDEVVDDGEAGHHTGAGVAD